MNKEDKGKFASAMREFELNSGDKLDKERLRFYWNKFKQFEIDIFEVAAKRILGTWEYPQIPPVAIFMKELKGPEPQIEDIATNEAMKVLEAIRIYGYTGKPKFDDIITRTLIDRRFKWQTLCSTMKEDQEKWFVKEFVEAYKSFNTDKHKLIENAPNEDIKKLTTGMLNNAE